MTLITIYVKALFPFRFKNVPMISSLEKATTNLRQSDYCISCSIIVRNSILPQNTQLRIVPCIMSNCNTHIKLLLHYKSLIFTFLFQELSICYIDPVNIFTPDSQIKKTSLFAQTCAEC